MKTRRSFLLSVVTAIASSPLFCRARELIGFYDPIVSYPSTWDGYLSPFFLRRYGLISAEEYRNFQVSVGDLSAGFHAVWIPQHVEYYEHLVRLTAQFKNLENPSPYKPPVKVEPGSFVASVFPEA